MESVRCNYCGKVDEEVLFEVPDLLLDKPDPTSRLVRCRNCGLVYQNPRPTEEEIGRHYPDDYDSYPRDLFGKQTPWLLRQAYRYGIRKRVRSVTGQKTGGRLLDVGCATGVFLSGFHGSPAWELHGIEPNRQAAEYARAQGFEVFNGTLDEASYPEPYFDVITLWDVFEHLHDPQGSLKKLAAMLKPDGRLILRVPNLDSWDAGWFGRYWAGLDAPRHLYIFSLDSIQKMLLAAGFENNEMKCNIGSYPTFVLSLRFLWTAKGVEATKRNARLRMLNHPVMRVLSAPVFYLLGLGLKGPLVTITSQKQAS